MIDAEKRTLTNDQVEILRALLYFDVFKYPLTKEELFENSAITISKEKFNEDLSFLLREGLIKQEQGFVLNSERDTSDISKRIQGNKGAQQIMTTAFQYSKKIASFPFVEGVMLSGSLSKNYYDEKSDIDFFIITKPNRLWICRSLLILRYKLLPKSKKKFWCTNYFISSEDMAIPDVNVFTGTELAHLIPTVNYEVYLKLLESNNWYKKRFPNKSERPDTDCVSQNKNSFTVFVESLLKGFFGARLDNYLLEVTLKRWRKKYPNMSQEDFDLQFRSQKNVCKRHTHGFQNKILVLWENKTREFEEKFNVQLHY